MPCFLIETGCRCRKKLVSITTMRLRRSTGAGCRKMLFQICDSRMISPSVAMRERSEVRGQRSEKSAAIQNPKFKIENPKWRSHRHKRRRVLPLPHFLLERAAFVDQQLPVVGQADRVPLQRPRGGALEVDAFLVKAAAVAGALEFLLGLEPVGRTTQVRA